MMINDDIDRIFSEAFSGDEVMPPAEVKRAIDQKLFGTGYAKIVVLMIVGAMFVTGLTLLISGESFPKPSNDVKAQKDIAIPTRGNNVTINASSDKVIAPASNLKSNVPSENQRVDVLPTGVSGIIRNSVRGNNPAIAENTNKPKGTDKDLSVVHVNPLVNQEQDNNNFANGQSMIDDLGTKKTSYLTVAGLPGLKGQKFPGHIAKQRFPMSLSLYSGSSFGVNKFNLDPSQNIDLMRLNEGTGLDLSAEFGIGLTRFSEIKTGLGYENRNWSVEQSDQVTDSVFTGFEWVLFQDSTMQWDSVYMATYDSYLSAISASKNYHVNAFVLPVYYSRKFELATRLDLTLSLGARFKYLQYKEFDNEVGNFNDPASISKFDIDISLRPELNYHFTHFSLGLYSTCNGNLLNSMQWDFAERRRLTFGTGMVFRYVF